MKNSNATLNKEIKYEFVQVLERRLDDKLDIMNEKQKYLNDKMSAMRWNMSTMEHNLRIITQNENTIMEVVDKLSSSTNHINSSDMLDQYGNKNESKKVDQDNKQDKETIS